MNQKRLDAIRNAIEEEEANSGWKGQYHINMDVLEKAGIGKYKAKVGDNYLTILPQKNLDAYFTIKILVHYSIGINNSSFLCPSMIDEKCPICEKRSALVKIGASKDELKPYNFGTRYLFFVVDTESEETAKEGVKLFDAPKSHYTEIKGRLKIKRTGEYIDITDPEEGRDFTFKRVGEDVNNTKYSEYSLEDRTFDVLQKWLDTVIEFDEVLVMKSYDEIKEEMGVGEEETATRRRGVAVETEDTADEKVVEEEVVRKKPRNTETKKDEAVYKDGDVAEKDVVKEDGNTDTPTESVSSRSSDIKERLKKRLAQRKNKDE